MSFEENNTTIEDLNITNTTQHECLVRGTRAELYDCCSGKALTICTINGYLDCAFFVLVLALFITVLIKRDWFKKNYLVIYVIIL